MPGLIDSTGLSFGQGLEWQEPIGGAGLTITPKATNSYVAEDGVSPYVAEDGTSFYVTE